MGAQRHAITTMMTVETRPMTISCRELMFGFTYLPYRSMVKMVAAEFSPELTVLMTAPASAANMMPRNPMGSSSFMRCENASPGRPSTLP